MHTCNPNRLFPRLYPNPLPGNVEVSAPITAPRSVLYLSTLLLTLVLSSVGAYAETALYVRPGANGANTGSNWENAFTTLPATLVRGAVYYLADGNYPSYTFSTPANGTTPIYVKKATALSHGTDTGWSSAYGDGIAKFTGTITINTSYIHIDGVTGSGTANYGIEIQPSSPRDVIVIGGGVTDISLKHIDAHVYPNNSSKGTMSTFAQILKATQGRVTKLHVANSYFHDVFGCHFQYTSADNWTLEHNYFARNVSTAAWHSAGVCDQGSDNMIVRHNTWRDIDGSAVIDLIEGPDTSNNFAFHGNVVYHTDSFGASIAAIIGVWNDSSNARVATNWRVYNNSFINIKGISSMYFASGGQNIDIKNNYWYCNRKNDSYQNYVYIGGAGVSYDYNFYSACAHPGAFTPAPNEPSLYWGPNCKLSSSNTNPFIDWAGGNFQLSAATAPGFSLAAPYNTDPLGIARGTDGVVDRGAFEFGSGKAILTAPKTVWFVP